MRLGSHAVLIAGALLALTGTAAAAVPRPATNQQIYTDLADNGRLDRTYAPADINRALRTPSLQGYERPAHGAGVPPVNGSRPPAPGSGLTVEEAARGAIPFSGLDLALLAGVGGPLLLAGASMRRLARVRAEG
jgi:hypothetical protein